MIQEYTEIPIQKVRTEGFVTLSKYDKNGDNLYICDQKSETIKKINIHDMTIKKFKDHSGIIWDLTSLEKNDMIGSVSGDQSLILNEISTGDIILKKEFEGIPRYISSNEEESYMSIYIEMKIKNKKNKLIILKNLSKENLRDENFYDINSIELELEENMTSMTWDKENLFIGLSDGVLKIMDVEKCQIIQSEKIHNKGIKSLNISKKFENCVLTGSQDGTSKEINFKNFEVINEYKVDFPINTAKYNQNERKIYIAGGLDAIEIAETKNNDLTVKVFTRGGKMKNAINGHFGPIRYLSISNRNKNFATGSQDGTVIIYNMENVNVMEKKEPEENKEKEKEMNNKDDIFGGIKNETKIETVKMKNLSFVAPKQKVEKLVPGMSNYKKALAEKEIEINENKKNTKNEEFDSRKTYAIKVTGLPININEGALRNLFEPYGRFAGRGIKMKKSEREFKKINGESKIYSELMVIINYSNYDSAIRAIEGMNKKVVDSILIDVELLKY